MCIWANLSIFFKKKFACPCPLPLIPFSDVAYSFHHIHLHHRRYKLLSFYSNISCWYGGIYLSKKILSCHHYFYFACFPRTLPSYILSVRFYFIFRLVSALCYLYFQVSCSAVYTIPNSHENMTLVVSSSLCMFFWWHENKHKN